MRIYLNDSEHDVSDGLTAAALIEAECGTRWEGVAVAVNDAVVPRSQWAQQALQAGDRVLIVQAVQGG